MSMSNGFETALLQHIFNNAAIANIGDATGLPGSAVAGSLYVALHTADPGEAGNQSTSEATYTGYARVAVARTAGAWAVSGANVSNAGAVSFPAATAGTNTITHFSIGVASSGAGMIIVSGSLGASLAVSNGITPVFAANQLTGTAD